MKIFITGCAGFLGSHLADRMLLLGHEVVGVDNLIEGGDINNVSRDVLFHKAECSDLEAMTKLMKGCDLVCHTACSSYDGLSVFSPYHVTFNTFQISVSVMTAAINNGVKRFVQCSSMARYGEQEKLPFTEDMLCKPENPYGIAKLSSEQVLLGLCQINGMEGVVLVPHNIIGARQCYVDPYRNVAAIMINRILQGKRPIIYGDGEQKRCFSFIDDVINCFEQAMLKPNLNGEVINVGPDEEFVSINYLCKVICELMNVEFDPIYVDKRPLEVKLATCSSDKARKLLDYSTSTNLEDGLKSMIDHISGLGPRDFKYNRPIEISTSKTPETWTKRLI